MRVGVCVCVDTYIRFGVLEDDEGQGEVLLGLVDQVLAEKRLSSALFLPLTAMQERHHPLEGIFYVALGVGLVRGRHSLSKAAHTVHTETQQLHSHWSLEAHA